MVICSNIGFIDQASAQKAKDYFDKTFIDTAKISVDFAATLNEDKILQDRQMKAAKGKQQVGLSKSEKLAKFANDLGIDPDTVLGKRDPASQTTENKEDKGEKTGDQEKPGEHPKKQVKGAPKSGLDSKRLYVYNFPFSISKEDLRHVFEKYGKVEECIIPTDSDHKSKGYGYVSFEKENDAIRAFAELDNQIAFGRILHIKPSEVSRRSQFVKPEDVAKTEKSSYKKLKKEEFMKNLNDTGSWNSLFLNPNTVMEYVAQEYGISKLELLNKEVDNPAVKIALAETKIINETKDWLKENGVDISKFEGSKKSVERSRTSIILKNLPKDATKNQLTDLLKRYGFVNRLLLPPNKAIAIAQFRNIDHARNVFEKLSGYSYHGVPLYLEYTPAGILEDSPEDAGSEEAEEKPVQPETSEKVAPVMVEEDTDAKAKTVFVKNLNFTTTEDGLKGFLREHGFASDLKYLKIITKNGRSCGYGFVEFNIVEAAEKVLRTLDCKILDGHKLELSITRQNGPSKTKQRKETEKLPQSNKIVIRNIDFAASKKELRELVVAFGEVRAVRMPSKVTGEHRGYAFVEFSNEDEAKNAYDALSHSHFYGRKLVIEYAKE